MGKHFRIAMTVAVALIMGAPAFAASPAAPATITITQADIDAASPGRDAERTLLIDRSGQVHVLSSGEMASQDQFTVATPSFRLRFGEVVLVRIEERVSASAASIASAPAFGGGPLRTVSDTGATTGTGAAIAGYGSANAYPTAITSGDTPSSARH